MNYEVTLENALHAAKVLRQSFADLQVHQIERRDRERTEAAHDGLQWLMAIDLCLRELRPDRVS